MQGQKGYVNDYVVIIFYHYINRREDAGMGKKVTWASFFVLISRRRQMANSALKPCGRRRFYGPSRSASNGSNRSQEASIFTCNSSSPRVLPRLMAITGLPCSTIALHRRNAE